MTTDTFASKPASSPDSAPGAAPEPGHRRKPGRPAAKPRTAIITGASRGIGLAIAEALIARGDRVCVTGRNAEALRDAVARLGPEQALGIPGRAHDQDHQRQVVERVVETFGRVDYLVNNVGTNPAYGPVIDVEPDLVRKILDVNVIAALGWTQQVYRAGMANGGGAVVNVSSVAGLRPAPGIGVYGMSKAALSHLTAELAVELAPGIRVNAVAPALIKTRFATALYQDREAELAATYPLARLGLPNDVAGAVAFLLSDEASWITGQTLIVDGGSSLAGMSM